MPEQLYGLTRRDITWIRQLKADLTSGKARILRRQESASGPNVQTVKPSSATLDTTDPNEDRYPGFWYERDPSTGALTQMDEVWIVTPNGEAVSTATFYEAAVQHGIENGRPVFCIPTPGASGGGTITVEEQDGTPTYSGISKLVFDQADGFVITNPVGGAARVDVSAATSSTSGIVSATTQSFGGTKTFASGTVAIGSVGSSGKALLIESGNEFRIHLSDTTNVSERVVFVPHLVGAFFSTVPGAVLWARNSSDVFIQASYGIEYDDGSFRWGVWGNDPVGNRVEGGIITQLGSLANPPTISGDPGVTGQMATDGTYLYVCVATDTWKRILLSTFV